MSGGLVVLQNSAGCQVIGDRFWIVIGIAKFIGYAEKLYVVCCGLCIVVL